MIYIGLNREKNETFFLSETIRPRAMIFGMYHHLVDYAPGAKNGPALGGHIFYIGLYREKHRKIFLSETIRLSALVFVL